VIRQLIKLAGAIVGPFVKIQKSPGLPLLFLQIAERGVSVYPGDDAFVFPHRGGDKNVPRGDCLLHPVSLTLIAEPIAHPLKNVWYNTINLPL
jgi:hypothetical protein